MYLGRFNIIHWECIHQKQGDHTSTSEYFQKKYWTRNRIFKMER